MAKIIVAHRGHGCDTGCFGHAIEVDGEDLPGSYRLLEYPDSPEEGLEWAKAFVRDQMGEEHVKDLDWENCEIRYDW